MPRCRRTTGGFQTFTTNTFIACEVFDSVSAKESGVLVSTHHPSVTSHACSRVWRTPTPPWGLRGLLAFDLLPWLSINHQSSELRPWRATGKGWRVNTSADVAKRNSLSKSSRLLTWRKMYINSAGCKCLDCKCVGLRSRRENCNDGIKRRTRVQCVRSILLIFAAFEAFFSSFSVRRVFIDLQGFHHGCSILLMMGVYPGRHGIDFQ